IARSFSASFMSNSKWRRAFQALSAPELEIEALLWKFVGKKLAVRGGVPDADCLGERYVRDVGFAQFPYKEIEWIEVPPANIPRGFEQVPFKHRPHDLARACAALERAGQFELTHLPEGLRVYGYR
ncbi:MAG: hypothetical protein ACK8QZ_08230, partial [Anaerolineales bacterium]